MITVFLFFNRLVIAIQFVALRATVGIRLKASTESQGSDYHEHGISPSVVINELSLKGCYTKTMAVH